jgi:hypothetical protein
VHGKDIELILHDADVDGRTGGMVEGKDFRLALAAVCAYRALEDEHAAHQAAERPCPA